MEILDFVRDGGGVVRARALRDEGCSSRALTDLVRSGALARPRGGWLALPDADPHLVAAARDGVTLTCITQAKRLDLWVLRTDGPHVGAPAHAGGVRIARAPGVAGKPDPNGEPLATVHWQKPTVPRHPHVLEDSIENVLSLVACCQPFEAALTIWESALRKQLVTSSSLERLPLPGRAAAVLAVAQSFSDSGLESLVAPRLTWLGLPIHAQTWIAGHRVDFLIGERLVLQIDGGHHVGAQRSQDVAHDAKLMLLGYHVIRVGYSEVIDHWHDVQDTIMRAVAQGLHRPA